MKGLGWAALGLLLTPLWWAVWVSFTPGALAVPPTGSWSLRWHRQLLSDPAWLQALGTSLAVAAGAAALATAVGVPAALARPRWLDRLILVPLAVPPLVLGVGLLPLLHALGLAGTALGLVLAHGLLGMPLAYLATRAAVRAMPPGVEDAARGLGATPWQVLWRVTLPLVGPGVLAGAGLAFVLSFNEFFVAQFVGGPDAETLPRRVWPALRYSVSPVVAAASVWGVAGAALAVLGFFREE